VQEGSGINIQTLSHKEVVICHFGIFKRYDGVTDVPTQVMFDFVCKPVGGELAVSEETTDSMQICATNGSLINRYCGCLE
jgi:8-oxo-dGTP diphosphatase